mgnify:CR=1 FL=1
MRYYNYDVSKPGVTLAYNRPAESLARIRVVVAIIFRKWFGHWPTERWHVDGFMAECWDSRGNRVTVCQFNIDPSGALR